MTCTHCGTEIADKALICYRCGKSTAAPTQPTRAVGRGARRPLWPAVLALLVLVAAGLFMASAAAGRVPDSLRWAIAGCAAVLLVWRLYRRMKR